MKWNNVSEKEPEHYRPVLIMLDYGATCVATWDDGRGRFVQDTSQAELYGAEPLGQLTEQPKKWAYFPWEASDEQ